MEIKKYKNGNFDLRYERKYDTDDYGNEFTEETLFHSNCNILAYLVTLICNSGEMDFILQDNADRFSEQYVLYNTNTNYYYILNIIDALKFFKGKLIKLKRVFGSNVYGLDELFNSYFEAQENDVYEIDVHTQWDQDVKMKFYKDTYDNNGNLYVRVLGCEYGEDWYEPYCDLTVNLQDKLPDNQAYIDVNNCDLNIIVSLEKAKLIKDTGKIGYSGYCIYPLYEFKEEFLKRMCL